MAADDRAVSHVIDEAGAWVVEYQRDPSGATFTVTAGIASELHVDWLDDEDVDERLTLGTFTRTSP